MKILVLGASGATGRHLVEQLLIRNQHLKIIVRPLASIPDSWITDTRIQIIRTEISEMTSEEATRHTTDCQAIASCLGHNMSLRGIYGMPHRLVLNTVKLFCDVVKRKTGRPVKFLLMNTAGYRNEDNNEQVSALQRIAMAIIRTAIPPHLDNEMAADYLRIEVGKYVSGIQWVVIRPDNLTEEGGVSAYDTNTSPVSTLFRPNKVSRINVAHFMAELITEHHLWERWKGQMPVISNSSRL
jgi:hypothetical protein